LNPDKRHSAVVEHPAFSVTTDETDRARRCRNRISGR